MCIYICISILFSDKDINMASNHEAIKIIMYIKQSNVEMHYLHRKLKHEAPVLYIDQIG